MEKLPGWNWGRDDDFNKTYNDVKQWIDNSKKMQSIYKPKDELEKRLANWCKRNRDNKKNNKISQDRIYLLEQLPGWYWYYHENS